MNAADAEAQELCILAVTRKVEARMSLNEVRDIIKANTINIFDDSDLALQVALMLGISFKIDMPGVIVTKFNYYWDQLTHTQCYEDSVLSSQPAMKAVRRAIVYSGAEIGKRIRKDEDS